MRVTELIQAADDLSRAVARLTFSEPVTHVYNPLDYARENHAAYVEAYGQGPKRAVFLGMNPGPWGMAQTGVPFGDAAMVRGWLKIDNPVGRPEHEHPKRPVQGLGCPRSEVSGTRLWGAAKEHFTTPERFFRRFYVANYCPLCFMEATGRNRVPEKLPISERTPLFEACDAHLRRLVRALSPTYVVGVGAFAANRARVALEGMEIEVAQILHPSPASPAANKGWSGKVVSQLVSAGVCSGDM